MSLVTEYSRGSRWMMGAALLSYQNICNSGKHGSIGRYDDRIMVTVELIISLTRESVRYFPVGNQTTVDFCPVSRVRVVACMFSPTVKCEIVYFLCWLRWSN